MYGMAVAGSVRKLLFTLEVNTIDHIDLWITHSKQQFHQNEDMDKASREKAEDAASIECLFELPGVLTKGKDALKLSKYRCGLGLS